MEVSDKYLVTYSASRNNKDLHDENRPKDEHAALYNPFIKLTITNHFAIPFYEDTKIIRADSSNNTIAAGSKIYFYLVPENNVLQGHMDILFTQPSIGGTNDANYYVNDMGFAGCIQQIRILDSSAKSLGWEVDRKTWNLTEFLLKDRNERRQILKNSPRNTDVDGNATKIDWTTVGNKYGRMRLPLPWSHGGKQELNEMFPLEKLGDYIIIEIELVSSLDKYVITNDGVAAFPSKIELLSHRITLEESYGSELLHNYPNKHLIHVPVEKYAKKNQALDAEVEHEYDIGKDAVNSIYFWYNETGAGNVTDQLKFMSLEDPTNTVTKFKVSDHETNYIEYRKDYSLYTMLTEERYEKTRDNIVDYIVPFEFSLVPLTNESLGRLVCDQMEDPKVHIWLDPGAATAYTLNLVYFKETFMEWDTREGVPYFNRKL